LKYLIVLFLLLTSALAEGQADKEPAPQARKSGLSVGGQFRHSGATLRQVAQPDDIIIHAPEAIRRVKDELVGLRNLSESRALMAALTADQSTRLATQATSALNLLPR
jgi:hypothetical protein